MDKKMEEELRKTCRLLEWAQRRLLSLVRKPKPDPKIKHDGSLVGLAPYPNGEGGT